MRFALYGAGRDAIVAASGEQDMNDLFGGKRPPKGGTPEAASYSAKDIEVLEGLEPVRRRPGMYIGGTDETALHHLAAEILDNAMDEAVAGHASFIEVTLEPGNWLTVRDNGRGIPVDPHPKFKNLSALGSHPDHAAFGRQVRRQGLRDLGRPARRRQFGGQRAVGGDGGRGRARPRPVEAELRARQADHEADQRRAGAQPPRHLDPLQAGPDGVRRHRRSARRGCTGCAAPRPTCSAACRSAGPAIRRCCAAPRTTRRPRRCCTSRAACATAWRRISASRPCVLPQLWAGEADLPGEATGRAGMGGRLAGAGRGLPPLLLQHHPDHPGRHARGRASAPRC